MGLELCSRLMLYHLATQHMHVCTYICIHAYTHTYTYIYNIMYVCMYYCTYACVHVCIVLAIVECFTDNFEYIDYRHAHDNDCCSYLNPIVLFRHCL